MFTEINPDYDALIQEEFAVATIIDKKKANSFIKFSISPPFLLIQYSFHASALSQTLPIPERLQHLKRIKKTGSGEGFFYLSYLITHFL